MGVSAQPAGDGDMNEAFAGGAGFIARLEQLSAAKVAAERAEASLNLATAAKLVLDQADAMKAEGERIVASARREAEKILAAAKAEADVLRLDAEQAHGMAAEATRDSRARAAETIAAATSRAEAVESAARRTMQRAEGAARDADTAQRLAEEQSERARHETETATKSQARLDASLAILREACAKVLNG